jgi:hypothetical protein
MGKALFIAFVLVAAGAPAHAQQQVDGKGKSCTSVAAQCRKMGGDEATCAPKRQQCMQTGTFYGNRYTITNLTRK